MKQKVAATGAPARARSPLDIALDRIEWKPVAPEQIAAREAKFQIDGLPYTTQHGTLDLGGFIIDVAVLNNGKRIFTEETLERFLGGEGRRP